jgi:hypothetical protein
MKTWRFVVATTVFLGGRGSSGRPTHQRRHYVDGAGKEIPPDEALGKPAARKSRKK